MRIMTNPKKIVASAPISELQSSDVYLTLKARLFDLRANLNGVRVTQAFLDEIIENEAKYICHPLYADIRGLVANKKIGHMYNSQTGEFHTTQIGAFYQFEKEEDDDNAYLVGYARVPKRNKAVCKALSDLFTDNALKFSFEVNCCTYDVDEDGTMVIDAAEGNYWEGECVVTFPACKDAIAQELIAECLGKGDEIMADENKMNTESEAKEMAESTQAVETANEATGTQTAETIYVTQEHTEIDEVHAYNCNTDESVNQRVVVETRTCTPVQIAEDEKDEEDSGEEKENEDEDVSDEKKVAEEESDEEDENEDDEASCGKQVAENGNWAVLIAEMRDSIDALRKEIAQMRTSPEAPTAVIAETQEEDKETTLIAQRDKDEGATTVNPFMASITAPKKYALLDREEKPARKYSLLDRA